MTIDVLLSTSNGKDRCVKAFSGFDSVLPAVSVQDSICHRMAASLAAWHAFAVSLSDMCSSALSCIRCPMPEQDPVVSIACIVQSSALASAPAPAAASDLEPSEAVENEGGLDEEEVLSRYSAFHLLSTTHSFRSL